MQLIINDLTFTLDKSIHSSVYYTLSVAEEYNETISDDTITLSQLNTLADAIKAFVNVEKG